MSAIAQEGRHCLLKRHPSLQLIDRALRTCVGCATKALQRWSLQSRPLRLWGALQPQQAARSDFRSHCIDHQLQPDQIIPDKSCLLCMAFSTRCSVCWIEIVAPPVEGPSARVS